jgi:hypothetical protein
MERGNGRGLTTADFGAGKISSFSSGDLGTNWPKVHALAAYRLDAFLRRVNTPFKITSSYRSPAANVAAAGAGNSRHLPDAKGLSNAFDVYFSDPKSFFTRGHINGILGAARAEGLNGVGFYLGKPLVHVDVRPAPWSWLGEKVKDAAGNITMKFYPRDKIVDILAGPAAVAVGSAAALILLLALLVERKRPS